MAGKSTTGVEPDSTASPCGEWIVRVISFQENPLSVNHAGTRTANVHLSGSILGAREIKDTELGKIARNFGRRSPARSAAEKGEGDCLKKHRLSKRKMMYRPDTFPVPEG